MNEHDQAIRLYRDFHRFEPDSVGHFHDEFRIPRRAVYAGEATCMFYASDKRNPETDADEGWQHYFHEHGPGVGLYRCDGSAKGRSCPVPRWLWSAETLTRLGVCEGYRYTTPAGSCVDAEVREPVPEWYATPCGTALLVVQDRRDVVALVWGGALRVMPEGVVG